MTVVIDANIALALAIPLPYSDQAKEHIDHWQRDGTQLVAPALWGYEVVSGLCKAWKTGLLTLKQAASAIDNLWALGVEEITASEKMHRQALVWADQLGHTVACDAQYLVVAQQFEASFWTADERLVRSARSISVDWIHWVGEVV